MSRPAPVAGMTSRLLRVCAQFSGYLPGPHDGRTSMNITRMRRAVVTGAVRVQGNEQPNQRQKFNFPAGVRLDSINGGRRRRQEAARKPGKTGARCTSTSGFVWKSVPSGQTSSCRDRQGSMRVDCVAAQRARHQSHLECHYGRVSMTSGLERSPISAALLGQRRGVIAKFRPAAVGHTSVADRTRRGCGARQGRSARSRYNNASPASGRDPVRWCRFHGVVARPKRFLGGRNIEEGGRTTSPVFPDKSGPLVTRSFRGVRAHRQRRAQANRKIAERREVFLRSTEPFWNPA